MWQANFIVSSSVQQSKTFYQQTARMSCKRTDDFSTRMGRRRRSTQFVIKTSLYICSDIWESASEDAENLFLNHRHEGVSTQICVEHTQLLYRDAKVKWDTVQRSTRFAVWGRKTAILNDSCGTEQWVVSGLTGTYVIMLSRRIQIFGLVKHFCYQIDTQRFNPLSLILIKHLLWDPLYLAERGLSEFCDKIMSVKNTLDCKLNFYRLKISISALILFCLLIFNLKRNVIW